MYLNVFWGKRWSSPQTHRLYFVFNLLLIHVTAINLSHAKHFLINFLFGFSPTDSKSWLNSFRFYFYDFSHSFIAWILRQVFLFRSIDELRKHKDLLPFDWISKSICFRRKWGWLKWVRRLHNKREESYKFFHENVRECRCQWEGNLLSVS